MGNRTNLITKRKELKYYISCKEYVILSNFLRKVLTEDKYNNKLLGGYFIRSLYFDTFDNKAFEEKMAGIEKRAKYRLRLYDINTKKVKFEIKSKFNDCIVKETAIISREDAIEMQNMNYEVMLKYNNPVLNKAYKEFKKSPYYPVVLTDYLREAFIGDFNKIRITFDRFLKSTPLQLDLFKKEPLMIKQLKKGEVIMEIKYNNFMPEPIKRLLQLPSFERSAISKYCIGRLDNFENTPII